jgi:hypothetical protein
MILPNTERSSIGRFFIDIVADMLAIMIEHANVDGLIEGVIPHLVDRRLSILQYADDNFFYGT